MLTCISPYALFTYFPVPCYARFYKFSKYCDVLKSWTINVDCDTDEPIQRPCYMPVLRKHCGDNWARRRTSVWRTFIGKCQHRTTTALNRCDNGSFLSTSQASSSCRHCGNPFSTSLSTLHTTHDFMPAISTKITYQW